MMKKGMKHTEILKGLKLLEDFKKGLEPVIADLEKGKVQISKYEYSYLYRYSDELHIVFKAKDIL